MTASALLLVAPVLVHRQCGVVYAPHPDAMDRNIAKGVVHMVADDLACCASERGAMPTVAQFEAFRLAKGLHIPSRIDPRGKPYELLIAGSTATVRSAGADGDFDTGDDVVERIRL